MAERKDAKKFGTFSGVFTPNLLTILGVIMFLRLGWVVGNGGLLGAILIISISFTITAATALSLSSITTNIKIGGGGAYSIISQSLGLEVGGSIGIPLFISQSLAVAMYVFGFRAGWLYIFPDHPELLVDLLLFAVIFAIAFISAGLAFKVQYLIMAAIGFALMTLLHAALAGSMEFAPGLWGQFPGSPEGGFQGVGFWTVFAVFFPAATGIMAGANMSGELKDPRKSIPVGTIAAVVLSYVIYIGLAIFLAFSAETEELVSNYNVLIDISTFGPAILVGLLGATFSSALASLVGAPRILQALGEHRIIPKGGWFARKARNGEPRNALFMAAGITGAALFLRDLNVIAPLITMFFLITYGMINMVILIEQNLKLVSFRPLFRIPRLVPLIGAFGCIFVMFIVNPVFALVAVIVVIAIHAYLIKKHLRAPYGDVRSGLFVAVAEWSAKKIEELSVSSERAWKMNLLVPVREPKNIDRRILKDIAYPKGSVKLFGITGRTSEKDLEKDLDPMTEWFRDNGIFSSWTIIETPEFEANLLSAIEALSGTVFSPSVVFVHLPLEKDQQFKSILEKSAERSIGVIALNSEKKVRKGKKIRLWIRNQGPDWELKMRTNNIDLAVLTAYKLKMNWKAELEITAVVSEKEETERAKKFVEELSEYGRLPNTVNRVVSEEDEKDLPDADINIIPIRSHAVPKDLREKAKELGKPCLFTMDSGKENALA